MSFDNKRSSHYIKEYKDSAFCTLQRSSDRRDSFCSFTARTWRCSVSDDNVDRELTPLYGVCDVWERCVPFERGWRGRSDSNEREEYEENGFLITKITGLYYGNSLYLLYKLPFYDPRIPPPVRILSKCMQYWRPMPLTINDFVLARTASVAGGTRIAFHS